MNKKNIKPQQTAPVQRETTASFGSKQGAAVVPAYLQIVPKTNPFAGDDAE